MNTKKILLVITILTLTLNLFASQKVSFIKGANNGFEIINHNDMKTDIHISLSDIFIDKGENDFDMLSITGGQLYADEIGKPQIPFFRKMIAIPDRGDVKIEIKNKKSITLINKYNIMPIQEPLLEIKGFVPEWKYDEDFYNTDAKFPGKIAEIKEVGAIRSYRYANIYIFPLQYNPLTGETEIIYEFDIEITYSGIGENEMKRTIPVSDRWLPIYEMKFSNWEYVKNSKPSINDIKTDYFDAWDENTFFDEGDYLILVVSDEMTAKIKELAAWKAKLGYTPVIKQVQASISVDALYDTIEYCYDNWSTPPEFVLLVGEGEENEVANHIEAHRYSCPYSYGVESGIARNDHYYSLMPTSDRHSDLFISRIPARDASELGVWIDKVIEYEGNPPSGSWFTSYFCIGDIESGRIFHLTARQFGLNLEANGDFDDLDTLLECNFADNEMGAHVIDSIDEGHNVMVFRGHGDEGAGFGFYGGADNSYDHMFMRDDVPGMSTESMGMGFMFAPTCLANNFAYPNYESMGELMCNMTGKGITGYFGATNVSLSFYNDSMALGISHAITGASATSEFQVVSVYGKEYMETLEAGSDLYFELEHYLMNEVGDPACRIWTDTPVNLVGTHNVSYYVGLNEITIHIEDDNNNDINSALVTVWDTTGADAVYLSGLTNSSGNITFSGVDFIDEGLNEVMITASKENYIPYQGNADIEAGSKISYISSTVLDSPSPILIDAKLNNGEITDIDVTIKNNTGSNQNTVNDSLSTSSSYVSMVTGTDSYGNIADAANALGTFRVNVGSNAPHGENVEFTLIITYAGNTDTSLFTLTVEGVSYVSSDKSELVFDYFGSKQSILNPVKIPSKAITGYDTLQFDNYPSESNIRTGTYWGVKFAPTSVCSLKTVLWGRSNTSAILYDTIYVYTDNSGQPGTLLNKQVVTVGTGGTRIVSHNYNGPQIDGDFWILMYAATKANGGNRYYMVSDNANSGNSYTATSIGGTWSSYASGDIVIRAGIGYYTEASDSGLIYIRNNDPDTKKIVNITSIDVKNDASWITGVSPGTAGIAMDDSAGIMVYIDTIGLDHDLTYVDTLLIYTDADIQKNVTLQIPVILQNISTGMHITSLTAYTENNGVMLKWNSEKDLMTYISRSNDKSNINIINSFNSNHGMNKYYDATPYDGYNYYSLGIKTITGDVSWSSPMFISIIPIDNNLLVSRNFIANNNININFSTINKNNINISIFDATGRLVKMLVNKEFDKGKYLINIDSKNMPSGIYFIKMSMPGFNKISKINVIR